MDHRVTPCHDEDFEGYVKTHENAKVVTGEHKIPWPPLNVHRHPSTFAEPLFALGCTLVFITLFGLAALGILTVMRWLF